MGRSKLEILVNAKDDASGMLGGISKTISGMASVAGGILAAGFIQQIGSSLVNLGKDSITAASNLAETANKINVVFGEAAGQINQFASDAATSLGQSQQQALDAAASFGVFGKSAGLSGVGLADFSSSLVGLSSDLASFYNTSPEQAIEAIGAALRGESEPIRSYGVLLDDATLRQAALEAGIVKTTKQALTPQQKVLAAYQVIMKQTTDAQGDFARTGEGLANSQRVVTAQMENLKAELGKQFLPIMEKGAQVISKVLLPAGEALLNKFIFPAIPALASFAGTAIDLFSRLASGAINFKQAIYEVFGEQGLGLFLQAQTFFQPFIDAIFGLFAAVQSTLPAIQVIFAQMWEGISWILQQFGPQILANVTGIITSIGVLWQQHGATVMTIITTAFQMIVLAVSGALLLLSGIVNTALLLLSGNWTGAWDALLATLTTFLSTVLQMAGTNLEEFNAVWSSNFSMLQSIVQTGIGMAIQAVLDAVGAMTAAGEALVQGMRAGFESKVYEFLGYLRGIAGEVTSLFNSIFGIHSPSKVMEGIGKNLMLGMEQGIRGAAYRPQLAAATAANGIGSMSLTQQNTINTPIDMERLAFRTAEIMQRNGRR